MLEVQNIYKDYDGKPLLEGVSLALEQSELVALLGPSGSGKSTLLRIIAGLEEPDAGRILWNGQDLRNLPVHKRGFGLMFQDYALFPHRSVANNIAFGLQMQGLSRAEQERRIAAALQMIQMPDFAERAVTELSGGEQQRVALARALAPQPRLLMLDEPLGALDHTLRVDLIQELRRILREQEMPVIYVTHDRDEAFALADRLVVLHNGKVIQSGSPSQLYQHPESAWLASFLGLGNLVPATAKPDMPGHYQSSLGQFYSPRGTASGLKEVALLLRPQDAVIGLDSELNRITARVKDSVFNGEHYLLALDTPEKLPFQVQASQAYPPGTSLSFSFPAEKILALVPDHAK